MKAYLDASVVFSLIAADAHSPRVRTWADGEPDVTTSLWSVAEVTSALALKVRMGQLADAERWTLEARLDDWIMAVGELVAVAPVDFVSARRLILDLDVALRTPDALHLAACHRSGLSIATVDAALADAARAIGVPVVDL